MTKVLGLVIVVLAGGALAGCSKCDIPTFGLESCRGGPPAAPDSLPPVR
ncbi:MAG: hypothetical protein J0H62_11770 [Rhizobiales bacterium]|nr:hypothetical protein [Hyphomicrobiales bacterium]